MLLRPTQSGETHESVWIFNDQHSLQRATLIFDSDSNNLLSKSWTVTDGDDEQTLERLQKRYSSAHFTRRDVEWTNPHIAPDEVYFEDNEQGISIEMSLSKNKVSSISWFDPKVRELAKENTAEKKQPYRVYQKPNGLISIVTGR